PASDDITGACARVQDVSEAERAGHTERTALSLSLKLREAAAAEPWPKRAAESGGNSRTRDATE
ncbi:Uncharacterized protein DAT39_004589, partial [Clarias magur]